MHFCGYLLMFPVYLVVLLIAGPPCCTLMRQNSYSKRINWPFVLYSWSYTFAAILGCVVAVLLFEGNMDSANKFDARAAATLAFEWTAWACQLGKHYPDMAGAISFMMFYCMLYFPA